ncbi:MAG: AAA family ATPase [Planctomycetia bacterium]|nr:AAA family ATPase [Planctomycetia bacterium]
MTTYRENHDVRRPFLSTPDARVYFPASTVETARRNVTRCMRREEGVAVVIGDCGVGKTILARKLAEDFENDALVAFVSATRRLDVKSFLQQVLYSRRQNACGCDETDLRLMTLDYLENAIQERCVILVDDAHNIASGVFDELRMLIDHAHSVSREVNVALFGAAKLEERLNQPSLYSFQQRVVAHEYLEPYTPQETSDYIQRELLRAEYHANFEPSAARMIAKFADGSPRVTAQLCDRALWLAEEKRAQALEDVASENDALLVCSQDVQDAWACLQCLPQMEQIAPLLPDADPTPRNLDVLEENKNDATATDSDVIEFGSLDDDFDDMYNDDSASQTAQMDDEQTVSFSSELPEFDDFDQHEEEEPEDVADLGPIDAELDARLNARFAPSASAPEHAPSAPLPPQLADARARRLSDDATYIGYASQENDATPSFDVELDLNSDEVALNESPRARSRRPIENGDDGSRAFHAQNGYAPEDFARFAATERYLDEELQALPEDDPLRAWATAQAANTAPRSLDDRAYRQIIASCYRSTSDFSASDQYLNELRLLEQEIAEEANLIRRIRSIHLQLRQARQPVAADHVDATSVHTLKN